MRRTIPEQEKNTFVKIDEITEKDQWQWIPRGFWSADYGTNVKTIKMIYENINGFN
jgi:hypothetical protein